MMGDATGNQPKPFFTKSIQLSNEININTGTMTGQTGRLTQEHIHLLREYNDLENISTHTIDGKSMTIPEVLLAYNRPDISWKISEEVRQLTAKNSRYLQDKVSAGDTIYGITTGFGGSADVRSPDIKEIQRALVQHLKAGFGEKLDSDIVRGVMLIRANSLSRGYSGVRPDIIDCLLGMVNENIVPIVPKRGTISASGDLLPTSYIAAAMMGKDDSKVVYNDTKMTAREAFTKAGISHVTFQAKEALAVVNSASFAAALGARVLYDASTALLMTQAATALSVESLLGKMESFHPTIHQCMPHRGQIEAAANILSFLEGSTYAEQLDAVEDDYYGLLKQDRYALRTSAQWLGPAVEVISQSITRITTDLNSANDNPIIDHRKDDILHCGNFQGTMAAVAMDQARQAIQLCGKLLFAQMSEMLNVKMSNGLPPNLCGSDPSVDFGMKGMDTAMASYMSELDYLTAPITNHVLSAEMHNQSVNSLAFISARLTREALEILQMMLSNILYAHTQAIDLRWLEKQTSVKIAEIAKNIGIDGDDVILQSFPWYSFAYRPVETLTSLKKKLKITQENGNAIEVKKITQLHSELIGGNKVSEVSSGLGKGTQKIYLFIREQLKIPFNEGQRPLDDALETIFAAVQKRQIVDVVLDVFKACGDRSGQAV